MIYVGCALAKAPLDFIEKVEDLKKKLKEDHVVLDFMGFNGTEQEVFTFDINQVLKCRRMLAICDFPSLGLGYEIATALSHNKPVIAVAHLDSVVSRMILGITLPGFSFHRYKDLLEVRNLLL